MEKAGINRNVAVVGCGHWGKNLVRNFFKLGALCSICDIKVERMEELILSYPGLNTEKEFSKILEDPQIKAVVISTPAESHYFIAKEALLADKDVFVEKPLSLTVQQGKELVELAKERGRILMVGHLLEYHPTILKLKELVKKGELGKVNYIYSTRLNLGKFRTEENILWSFAPHDISVILLLLEEMPTEVSAHGGSYLYHQVADVTITTLNFRSGVKSHIFVSWLHPYKEQKLVIVGTLKMAVFDDVSFKNKLLLYDHKIDWIDRVPIARKEEAKIVECPSTEPLQLECEHFLECILNRKTPKTDGNNGLRVLEVLAACQSSLERGGQPVALGEIKRSYFAHPTAIIDEPCEIGEGTKIWHYSHIMRGAKIGKNCNIGQNVVIFPGVLIGNGVKIQNNVSVYTGVTLEDDVFCGPSMVFTNVLNPRSHIPRKDEFKNTLVRKGATIGANATIVCGVTIDSYAFVGAGAVVTKDVPAHALVVGNPARIVGWVCQCGEKLNFNVDQAKCYRCADEYKKEQDGIKKVGNGKRDE
jgi:UDP-2-acetamido-3-amino-2,3-dideoxy-glucuronate N-acetyltransferase